MFKKIIFLTALFSASFALNAASTLGGDITWDCLGNGKYQFTVNVFYMCDSTTTAPADTVWVKSNGNVTNIACARVDSIDISPNCGGSSGISCGGNSGYGGLVRMVYRSGEVVLPGVPTANGWTFYADLCCRGNLANSPSDSSLTLHSVMYAPSNVNSAFPCYDSSPTFYEIPHIYFASFTQQNLALANLSDVDADSVSIAWSEPWDSYNGLTPSVMPFDTAYNYQSPLPGVLIDPANVPGVLNEVSGHYSFYQVTQGKFATSLKITSYRQGQKIAEVNRDLPMIILPNVPDSGACAGVNNIPVLSAISLNQNSLTPVFTTDTVYYKVNAMPGDTVSLKISAFDSDLKPNCLPQEITFTGSGAALSLDTLYQDPTNSAISGNAATIKPFGSQNGFVSTINNQVQFNWIIEKQHAPFPGKTFYQFNFRFADNNCNITGTAEIVVRIAVDRSIFLSPDSVAICQGDSAKMDLTGDLSNLSWMPQTGVINSGGAVYLNPTQSTFYTVTDLNSGYSESVFVRVDNIATPVISSASGQFNLMNPAQFDSTFWTLNQAPIYTAAPSSTIVPALSGSYRSVNTNGTCVAQSNILDTVISGNFSLNPDALGNYKGLDKPDATFGVNIRYNGNVPLMVKHITIAANHTTPNIKLMLKIYDSNTQEIFSTDSVVATQNGQLKAYGTFELKPQELYFVSLYLGDSTNFYLYKAKNWPVVSKNGLVSIFNAARADGEVSLPSTTSEFYPYIHFHFDGFIGIDENRGEARFNIYPNPAKDILNLTLIDDYTVYNTTGQIVIEVKQVKILDVSSLKSGVYWVANPSGVVKKWVKL